jgi:hypothetical protein
VKRIALGVSTILPFLALSQVAESADPAKSPSIAGRYLSVIESEWNLEVTLETNGTATYEFSYWPAGKSSTETKKDVVKGTWSAAGTSVRVDFPALGTGKSVAYEVTPCLSYKTFGADGCSSGLMPIASTMSQNYLQPLWDSRSYKFQSAKRIIE